MDWPENFLWDFRKQEIWTGQKQEGSRVGGQRRNQRNFHLGISKEYFFPVRKQKGLPGEPNSWGSDCFFPVVGDSPLLWGHQIKGCSHVNHLKFLCISRRQLGFKRGLTRFISGRILSGLSRHFFAPRFNEFGNPIGAFFPREGYWGFTPFCCPFWVKPFVATGKSGGS